MNKLFKSILSMVLVLVLGVMVPLQNFAFAAAEDHLTETTPQTLEQELKDKTIGSFTGNAKLYVSDVMLANGDTADEAKQALHKAGYLVYDCDLNEGTDHKNGTYHSWLALKTLGVREVTKKYTYLGYKITTDRNKAITDLNVMDQEGGYQVFDYYQFAEKNMPGVGGMATGMKAACTEISKKLAAGSPAARAAKKYLDLFYVPASVKDTTGPRLGDYLLDAKRTTEDYKKLLLLLNTLVLEAVQAQLTLGLVETTLQTKTADGGQNADGKVASTYVSYNGIVGYEGLTDDGNWLKAAADKMCANAEFANVNKTDTSKTFADLSAKHGAQIDILQRIQKDGNLTDTAVAYLKSVTIEQVGGTVSAALGMGSEGCNAYDLLTKGSDRLLCLYFSCLPKYAQNNLLHDVLEVCASDCRHRVPTAFRYDKVYNIPWASSAVTAVKVQINGTKAATKAERAPYNDDIDSFITFMQSFAEQYKKEIAQYKKNGNQITLPEKGMTEEQADQTIVEAIEGQSDVSDDVPELYYVGIRDAFAPYKVTEDQSLLEYLISAVDGKKEIDDTLRAKIYPVVRVLGDARMYSVKSSNMLGFLINTIMTENEVAGVERSLEQYHMDLVEGSGADVVNVWVGTQRALVEEGEYVAITSDKISQNLAATKYNDAFSNEIPMTDKLKASLVKLALAGSITLGTAIILSVTAKAIVGFTSLVMSSLQAVTTMGVCGATIVASVMSCIATVAAVAFVIVVLVAVVFGILYLIQMLKPPPDPVYTPIPTIMLDSTRDVNNDLTNVGYYYPVRDPSGAPADINAFKAEKWLALYYSRNQDAGSPLTLGPNNSFFDSVKETNARPNKDCVPLSKFLRSDAYNLNANCYYDKIGGKYLYFYTEDSLAGIDRTNRNGKYIDSIMIAHSSSDAGTKLTLERVEGYQVLAATNLSPGCEYNTYIAYHTTDNESLALTDIRAGYATTAEKVSYGSAVYSNVQTNKEMRTTPSVTCEDDTANRKQTGFCYNLFTTTDRTAGDPILTKDLTIVTDLNNVPTGYDTVSYFAGVPLNFNAFEHSGCQYFDCKHFYLCYRSENATLSDTDYLAGFAFYSGSDDWLKEKDTKECTLSRYAVYSHGCTTLPWNLTPSLYNNLYDRTFLGYVTTRNPKKALTDIASFTGEPKSSILPQNITAGNNGYCVCDVFTQGDSWFYGKNVGSEQRWTRPSHTYFTNTTGEFYDLYWPKKTALMPRALYGCGPRKDVTPIKISDVVIANKQTTPSDSTNNDNLYRLTEVWQNKPAGAGLGTGWKSVHAIEQYYYDEYDANGKLLSSYDLGLGMNPTTDTSGTGSFYMFYKNGEGVRRRGNYVSNIRLSGSIDKDNAYNAARISALASAEDIVNLKAPIVQTKTPFKDCGKNQEAYYGTKPDALKTYSDNCYFVSVSYSDLASESIQAARVLEQTGSETALPKTKQLPLYDSASLVPYTQTSTATLRNASDTGGYMGYAMYTAGSGYDTNSVEVRFINTRPDAKRADGWKNAGSGVAEYYVGFNDTTDPFLFRNYAEGTAACICLKSYNYDAGGQNIDKYIESVAVAEAETYDGNMDLAAAKLGAMGYPYIIDFDLSENDLSYGSNTVTALGVRRTDTPTGAVKDIRVSPDDLGEAFDSNGIRYQRINKKPVKLAGGDGTGDYLYLTYGTSSDAMMWSDVLKNKTPLDEVDWFNLDYAEANLDPEFQDQYNAYFAAHPGMETGVLEYVDQRNKIKAAEWGLRSGWEEKTALTNVGFVPAPGSSEQMVRSVRKAAENAKWLAKDVYWAGCSSYSEDQLTVPVTGTTVRHMICGFDDSESSIGLRYTNMGNARFAPFSAETDDDTNAFLGSVFTDPNIMMLIVLSAAFLLSLAAVFIIYLKRRKRVAVQKEILSYIDSVFSSLKDRMKIGK